MVKDCRTDKNSEKYKKYRERRASSMAAATRRRLEKKDKQPKSKQDITKN